MSPERQAGLAQIRVRQHQDEATWTPSRRLAMLDELWQLAFELHGAPPRQQLGRDLLLVNWRQLVRAKSKG